MAQWEPKSVSDVIDDISNNEIVLPVIQRNLVWDEDKMELLFDSLLKGHSFGGIIALVEEKGTEPLFAYRFFSKDGEILDSDQPIILDHTTMMIIDGQQRLQAFYMGLKGGLNEKKLYFNLFSQDDYEFEFASQVNDLPLSRKEDDVECLLLWYPVTLLFTRLKTTNDDLITAREIIQNRNILDEQQKELILKNTKKFERAVFMQKAIGISQVTIDKDHPDNERRQMVELFRRLNDGGTRLSAMDLAASTLKGFNADLEIFLRREIPKYGDMGISQDEVVKLLFLLRDNPIKEVTDITKEDAGFAVQYSKRILKTLDAVRRVLKHADLYEYYHSAGKSVIPLYAIAYHIFYQTVSDDALDGLYANYDVNNPDFTNIKRWLYLSLLQGVFSRGRGWIPYKAGIRKIFGVVKQYQGDLFPTEAIFSVYETHPLVFSRNLTEAQIAGFDRDFVFYLMYDCHSLVGRDVDHVHPKSLLEHAQVPGEKIHTIINYQLLDNLTNRDKKRAKPLKEWLQLNWNEVVKENYLSKHLIPTNMELWSIENYDAFLQARGKLILEKIVQRIPAQSIQPAQPQPPQPTVKVVAAAVKTRSNGAAALTKEQRDPEVWLTGLADQQGLGNEFRLIVEAARSLGLYARFQNIWWIVMITNGENHNDKFFDLGADLKIWLYENRIAEYLGCPVEIVNEKIRFNNQIAPHEAALWVENLKSLFSSKQGKSGA